MKSLRSLWFSVPVLTLILGGCASAPPVSLNAGSAPVAQAPVVVRQAPKPPSAAAQANRAPAPAVKAQPEAPKAAAAPAPQAPGVAIIPAVPDWKSLLQAGIVQPVSHWDASMQALYADHQLHGALRAGHVLSVHAINATLKFAFPALTMAPQAAGPGPRQQAAIALIASWLKANPQVLVKVVSNCASVPPQPTLQTAQAYASDLAQLGVQPSRIALSNNGMMKVLAMGAEPDDPWNNRIDLELFNLAAPVASNPLVQASAPAL